MDVALRERQIARIQEWMRAILAPNQVVEVKALDPFSSRIIATADGSAFDQLARWAAERSGKCGGLYWSINPLSRTVGSGKGGAATVADIARRHWLYVDCDPKRPKPSNSTDSEKLAALNVASSIRDTLRARGFGGFVLLDSGNGYHLLIPIQLANDDAARNQHKLFLILLGERFGTPTVEVDPNTYHAQLASKIPATMVCRAPEAPGRPHRYTQLVEADADPHSHAAANVLALESLMRDWSKGRKNPVNEREALVKRATAYLEKADIAVQGQHGSDKCFRAACVLVNDFALSESEAFEAIQPWNARCEPPWSEKEIRHKLDGAAKQPGERGRLANDRATTAPPKSAPGPQPSANGTHTPAGKPDDWPRPIIIRASAVVPKKVEWLWPNRIPLGKLTTFAGVTGLGKTFTLCDISARVSKGLEWPGMSGGECAPSGQVVFISGEDEPDDTLVPRMIEMGADLDRITFLQSAALDRFTLADLPALDAALEDTGPDVKLVVIDPPTAYLGKVNDHRNAELRGVLSPLKTWAARYNVAIVFNTHVNKPQAAKVDAMMRVMGSVAWVNAVRAAHLFTAHPEEEDQRLFVPIKLNVGRMAKGLAYKIEITPELAKLVWGGEVDLTANEALNSERKPRREIATDWLIEQFRKRLEWPSDELFRAAKEEGVSRNAIFEAKATLNPKVKPSVNPDGSKSWIWSVAPEWEKFGDKKPYANAYGSSPATTERERAY